MSLCNNYVVRTTLRFVGNNEIEYEESLRGIYHVTCSNSKSVFTALHGMQTRSMDENYVCPSVKRVHYDKTEERTVQIFILYKR